MEKEKSLDVENPDAEKVTRYLVHWAMGRGQRLCCPNIYFFSWESDLLTFTRNGAAIEFEIKLSLSDFKADFKKEKHDKISLGLVADIPNYFNFVCPDGLIPLDMVPSYAGLVYIEKSRRNKMLDFREIKKAPRLTAIKPNYNEVCQQVAHKMTLRLYNKYYWKEICYDGQVHEEQAPV